MELSAVCENGTSVMYEESFWTGRRKLYVNGKESVKLGKRKFRSEEGGVVTNYEVKGNFLAGVTLIVDGTEKIVLAKNAWYDWLMIFIPLVGFCVGIFCGAIGGGLSALCCLAGSYFNATIARSRLNGGAKILLQILVAVVANAVWFAVYFVVVIMLFA